MKQAAILALAFSTLGSATGVRGMVGATGATGANGATGEAVVASATGATRDLARLSVSPQSLALLRASPLVSHFFDIKRILESPGRVLSGTGLYGYIVLP